MTGPEPPNREIIAQSSQITAENLSSTAMGGGGINSPPERIVPSDEKPGSDSSPRFLGLVHAVKEKVPPEEPPPSVLYRVQYLNERMDVVFSKEDKEPMEIQNTLSTLGKAVIEVITEVQIVETYTHSNAEKEEPRTAISVIGTKLKINSPAIITALQSVIEYYPGHSFSESSNTVMEPYAALIHHEEELKAYRNYFDPNAINSKDELCQRNVNAYEHIGVLQNILSQRSGKAVEAERQRHARGVATFEMLWLLFRPGTDVYSDDADDGNYNAYVIKSVTGGVSGGRPTSLVINAWSMNYDGSKIGRVLYPFVQRVFDGEKGITSLTVFPCEFWKEESKEGEETKPLKLKLEERGKVFFKLAQRQCMDYHGTTYSWPKKHVSIS